MYSNQCKLASINKQENFIQTDDCPICNKKTIKPKVLNKKHEIKSDEEIEVKPGLLEEKQDDTQSHDHGPGVGGD